MDYNEAKNILINIINDTEIEEINFYDSFNRVSASDLFANVNVPSFAKSPYDGYCFDFNDTKNASKDNIIKFEVIDEVPCGYVSTKKITKNKAIKILTGAKIPEGANCVCPFELLKIENNIIYVDREFKEDQNIIKIGEDIKEGTKFFDKGDLIDSGCISVMSSLNMNKIKVYKKPKVAIISTGSELIENNENEKNVDGKIFNSNKYLFINALIKLNINATYIGIIKDDLEILKNEFDNAIKNYDIVISTGGVSVGDYDLVEKTLKEIGCDILLKGLDMKPGMAACFAKRNNKFILSLSGNPMSAITSFYVVCVPFLKKYLGYKNFENKIFKSSITDDFVKEINCDRFIRGKLEIVDDKLYTSFDKKQGNIVIKSFINTNCFIKIPKNSKVFKGDLVDTFLI